MSKEHRFVFNNTIVIVEEPYKKDKGCVMVGKKLYDEVEILFKSYNKTLIEFFIKLQEYIADLESKLAEEKECSLKASAKHNLEMQNAQICVKELEAKLAESEKENNELKDKLKWIKEEVEENFVDGQKYDQLKQQLANYERIYTSLGFDNSKQFEDYVQFTMMNSDDKIKELRELQAKLAESEEQLNNSEQKCLICNKDKENDQLKQQLAEKEKSFKFKICRMCEQEFNQDKISFCIEQLEKAKNEITPIFCVPNGIYSNLHNEVFKTIDNQIKLLKEGKV